MILIFSVTLVCLFLHLIFFLGGKTMGWDELSKSTFECGFSSYFKSRYSLSIQYFLISLIFLFLDLEICFLLAFFNEESWSIKVINYFLIFSMVLTFSMVLDWKKGLLDWKT